MANTAAITGYFTEEEKSAIIRYANKHRIGTFEAVSALVKKALLQEDEALKKPPRLQIVSEKVERLEKAVDNWIAAIFRMAETNDRLGEQIACLQNEVDFLKEKIKDEASLKLSK